MTDDEQPEQGVMGAGVSRERSLGQTFAHLATSLVSGGDVTDLFDDLVGSCTDLLDTAAAGVMIADQRGGLQVMAASSEASRVLEEVELEHGEGPCLDCFRTSRPVAAVGHSEQAKRWPEFAEDIRARGLGAVYALPMRHRDDTIGALNMYRRPDAPLSEDDVQIGQALADVATAAFLQHRTIRASEQLATQLQNALNSRVVIEQAKGIISERAQVDMDTAFELLRGHARRTQSRLSELAASIVSGQLTPEQLATKRRRPSG